MVFSNRLSELTHPLYLIVQMHCAGGTADFYIVHSEERCEESEWQLKGLALRKKRGNYLTYEEDSYDGEEHDGSALLDTFICSLERGFCFNNTRLLLFES